MEKGEMLTPHICTQKRGRKERQCTRTTCSSRFALASAAARNSTDGLNWSHSVRSTFCLQSLCIAYQHHDSTEIEWHTNHGKTSWRPQPPEKSGWGESALMARAQRNGKDLAFCTAAASWFRSSVRSMLPVNQRLSLCVGSLSSRLGIDRNSEFAAPRTPKPHKSHTNQHTAKANN